MKTLNSIQYLRAIAALLVVYCHAIDLQEFLGGSGQQQFFYLENFGAIGVDIFFVISGFIIAYISAGKSGAKASIDFMKRRVMRIVPVYYIVSFLLLLLILIAGRSVVTKENVIKTITILPLFDSGPELWTPILVPGWTLGFEFFFYIIFSTIILFRNRNKELLITIIFILLVIAGKVFQSHNLQWQFVTNPLILEFCFGVLIALIYKSSLRISLTISKIFIAIAILLMIGLIINGYGNISEMADTVDGSSSLKRVILLGIPSTLLVFGLVFFEKSSPEHFFSNKWMLLLGNASYSIYLVHLIIFRCILFLLPKKNFIINTLPGDMLIIIWMLVAIPLSVAFYTLVEKKILKLLNKKRK